MLDRALGEAETLRDCLVRLALRDHLQDRALTSGERRARLARERPLIQRADTAAKNNLRDDLVALLRKLAGFVQENHGNDMAKLLASGFEAVSTNRTSVPLPKPVIREILRGNTGQLKVRVDPIPNAKNYEPQHALIGPGGTLGPWVGGGLFSNSQQLLLTGLAPGAEYMVQVRAIGGSTGYSDWSNMQSHRVM